MSYFDKLLAVILTTINPLTGRGIAIPLGIELGLPKTLVTIVSGASNFFMAVVLILLIDQLERISWIKNYVEKKRGKRITKFIEGKGLVYSVVFGPFLVGTFTIVLVFQALGSDKKRMILYSFISSLIVTPVTAWLSPLFVDLINQYKRILHF
jgi:uncharacterized membrane protein YeaQ/YmgE (transglycosylase-associated protein family)